MTDPASQHPYMYCRGNPIRYSDPSGYDIKDVWEFYKWQSVVPGPYGAPGGRGWGDIRKESYRHGKVYGYITDASIIIATIATMKASGIIALESSQWIYATGNAYWTAYGAGAGAGTGVAGRTLKTLVCEAQRRYPRLAGKIHKHHIWPQYLGGPKSGPTVKIDAAYHQVIHNEIYKYFPRGIKG